MYCARSGCSDDRFEERVFRHCLYPHVRWFCSVLNAVNSDYFRWDFELIRWAGNSRTYKELRSEVNNFSRQHPARGLLRGWLRIRLSRHRLLALAAPFFPDAGPAPGLESSQPAAQGTTP